MRFARGDGVILSGYPERYGWMDELVGSVGVVAEVDDDGGREVPAYGVRGLLPHGDLAWFGAGYLESLGDPAGDGRNEARR